MHIVENESVPKTGKKIYRSILLRESYRENRKVKKRTIANLCHCTAEEIAAIKLTLRHKEDLTVLGSLKESIELQEGFSVGAVWTVYQVGKDLGIEKALGTDFGKVSVLAGDSPGDGSGVETFSRSVDASRGRKSNQAVS